MTVFIFKIYHIDSNGQPTTNFDIQERYVLAKNEQEAEKKLDEYRKRMIADGFADFVALGCPTVELENVII